MAPRIGDRCYIGPGAKLFDPTRVGHNCATGASAVLSDLVAGDNVTIARAPARVISGKGSVAILNFTTPA
ncbi:MAG: hypothetical protein J0L89_08315 [Xanthomonadales bacterium]|nr:hypothetical protein [Xanthomonadales bacterium]